MTNHSTRAHATLSPSSAGQWVPCTASPGFIAANKDRLPPENTEFADEGTAAHELANRLLLGHPVDRNDPHVDAYVEWVRGWYRKATKQTLWVERRVELFYSPKDHGTTDATVWGKSFIFVGDLKYGQGVSVDAISNRQLAIYAESVIREIELVQDVPGNMPVILGIYQPRDRNNPVAERLWELTRNELADFCAHIEHAASTIKVGTDLKFVADPEKQCRFCKAKSICKHFASYGFDKVPELAPVVDNQLELPPPHVITREQRQRILAAANAIEAWFSALREHEIADLSSGKPSLQFKLVAGKSNRRWADEIAAEKLLKNYLTTAELRPPSDLVSVAQAEKLLKGKELSTRFSNALAKLITKPDGKPTLVEVTDKREALTVNAAEGFTKVEDCDV